MLNSSSDDVMVDDVVTVNNNSANFTEVELNMTSGCTEVVTKRTK